MLNFEAKEFNDLLSTMNKVLASNTDKPAAIATTDPVIESNENSDVKGRDAFLSKSREEVEEALTRYLKALLSTGNGLNTTATVNQLNNLSQFIGATFIGPLLRLENQQSMVEEYETLIISQMELGFNTIEALKGQDAVLTGNQKANNVTEIEIAFFRLGSLAKILHSLNNQSQLQAFIDKSISVGLAEFITNSLSICPADRQESFVHAICSILRPLQKLVGSRAATTTDGSLWSFSLVLCRCL